MRTLPAALFVAAAVGCAGRASKRAEAPTPARSPARDTLLADDLLRADSSRRLGAVNGTVAWLDDDVAYLRAGVPAVYGREYVAALLKETTSAVGTPVQWQPLGGGISRDARFGYTYGVAEVAQGTTGPSGEQRAPMRLERYIAVWRRGDRTPWRIIAYAEVGAPMVPDVALGGTAPPGEPVKGKEASVRDELRQTDTDFSDAASRSGVGAAFSSYVAPDGVMFAGSEIVRGPDEVRDLFAAGSSRTSLAWRPVHSGVASSGDLGFTVGEYVSTGPNASGAVTQRFGKYLTVWRKQRDGAWRFVVDGGNPSPAGGGARAAGRLGTP